MTCPSSALPKPVIEDTRIAVAKRLASGTRNTLGLSDTVIGIAPKSLNVTTLSGVSTIGVSRSDSNTGFLLLIGVALLAVEEYNPLPSKPIGE